MIRNQKQTFVPTIGFRSFVAVAGFVWLFFTTNAGIAQRSIWEPDTTFNKKRFQTVIYSTGVGIVGTYAVLGTAWYSGQTGSQFHWFDDGHEWLQIDKVGHAYGAYHESRLMQQMLTWSGVPTRKILLWGSLTGFLLQAPIEIFDGFSSDYGASVWDLVANASGAGLAALNYALWREHRITLKLSYWPTDFPDQRPDLLGNGLDELLKDYNGQTYWLCVSPDLFLPKGRFKDRWPDWLGIAVGYGGYGMIGGYGEEADAIIDAREKREWYLSLDIDLTRIRSRSGFVRTFLFVANAVRIPLPGLRWRDQNLSFMPLAY